MMVGITAWQQQVPLPKAYTGKENAWQIPLHPRASKNPVSIKGRFLRGAIRGGCKMAIPIFNPAEQPRVKCHRRLAELDEWGGHCGPWRRLSLPTSLRSISKEDRRTRLSRSPFALGRLSHLRDDRGRTGLPVDENILDGRFHGKGTDAKGNYAYYASTKLPLPERRFFTAK